MCNGYTLDHFNTLMRQGRVVREDSYVHAPLYYALTGRNGVRIHEGYGTVMAACAHPHIAGRILVFPEIGPATGRLTASVLESLQPSKGGVQLARYNQKDLAQLREHKLPAGYAKPRWGLVMAEVPG